MRDNISALGLLSGGLDSMLALRVIVDQGVKVKAINFKTPFFLDFPPTTAVGDSIKSNIETLPDVLIYARGLGCDVEVVDISNGYLQMLHQPRHGYGRNVNPCIDCHILMFETARRKMEDEGYNFIFTGEVLGQRPKSQRMRELKIIARQSGLEDRVLRPLSARLLSPTLPENEGWVDRNSLYDFQGRTRKPQMALAAQFGINEYQTPAGGCILTEPSYGKKVRDLWRHSDVESLTWDDYNLLRIGRHLRVNEDLKVVVARDESECNLLGRFVSGRTRLEPADVPGPVVLIDESSDTDHQLTAARICARYCKAGRDGAEIGIKMVGKDFSRTIEVKAFKPEEVDGWLIL